MKTLESHKRWMAGLMVAALSLALIAPAAQAHTARHHRYKGPVVREKRIVRYRPAPRRVVYIHRHDSVIPVLASFLGGLVIGAAVAHADDPGDYVYYDPYCRHRFVSLDAYLDDYSMHRYHHPRVVQVISIRTGECVDSYRYHEGYWYGSHAPYGDWDDE